MKKNLLNGIGILLAFGTLAQVEITTKSFELASQNKHKDWKILEAGRDQQTKEIFIKFGKPACDVSKTGGFWNPGLEYRGLKWEIDKLIFSNTFDYVRTDSKSYESSEQAMISNEMVFGKTFMPISGKGVGGALVSGAAMPSKPIGNAYLFKNIILPSVSLGGFKISTSYITCLPVTTDKNNYACNELVYIIEKSNENAKEAKGQRWIPMYNNPEPDGGNILFGTSGVNPDPLKSHLVFRKYDKNGAVAKELIFNYDYQNMPTVKELETAPGVFDYIFIFTPLKYKASKAPLTDPLNYEYIRVDGTSFEIKEKISFKGVYSKWIVQQVIEKDGAVYVMGQCSEKKDQYTTFDMYDYKDYNALQIVKISSGKVDFVSGFNKADALGALKQVSGVKGKTEPSLILQDSKVYINNGKVYFTGQSLKSFSTSTYLEDRDDLVTIIVDDKGKLEAYLIKAEEEYTKSQLHFSADGSTIYWSIFDFASYNKMVNDQGGMEAKHKLGLMSGLGVVKYNTVAKELSPFQSFNNEDWALFYQDPILFESDEEIVFKGKALTKKRKESEVVFISIKK